MTDIKGRIAIPILAIGIIVASCRPYIPPPTPSWPAPGPPPRPIIIWEDCKTPLGLKAFQQGEWKWNTPEKAFQKWWEKQSSNTKLCSYQEGSFKHGRVYHLVVTYTEEKK